MERQFSDNPHFREAFGPPVFLKGISMLTFIALVWTHFVADFLLQTDKMALNKSKSNKWLGFHCLVYSIPFLFAFGIHFGIITFLTHFATDYVTSRGTAYLWKKEERHWFFCLIGFDQAVHLTTLILTFHFLGLHFLSM